MLCYLHGDVIHLDKSCVVDVIQLAVEYDRENAVFFLQVLRNVPADEVLLDILVSCKRLIDENAKYIITTRQQVAQFDSSLFNLVLPNDTFCAREIDIFEGLILWAQIKLPAD